MALATARSVVAVVLLSALGVEGKALDKFWGFLDDVAEEGKEKSEVTTVAEMLEHGGIIQVEDCGKKADVMEVARTEFYRHRLQVRAYGNLSRTVTGGNVSVRMYKSSASQGSSTRDWMKRELAWQSVPHIYEEDLCKHFGKSHSQRGCPLPTGKVELRFAVDKLPPMVLAGSYMLKIRAIDASGKQVACVRAHMEIPRGKSGELFRRVQGVNNARRRPRRSPQRPRLPGAAPEGSLARGRPHRGRALESVTGDCACGFSDPVCGVNGRTYDGLCQAHCENVDVAYAGKCVDQIVGPDGRALRGDGVTGAFPVYDVTAGPALATNVGQVTSFAALGRLDSARAVQCYANYGDGGAGTCNVLNVASISEVAELSTVVFNEDETHEIAVAPFSDAVVVCYSDKGGTKRLTCKALTISGDGLEDNGEPVTINALAEEVPFVSLAALSDSVGVLCWSYVGYQERDRAGVCNKLTLEGGALVVGADYFFDDQTSTSDISVKAFSKASAVICWSAQGTGECSLLSLSDASGTDFTQGGNQVFYTKTSEFFESVVVVSFTATQGAVCYADGTDENFVACKVLLVDGAALTVGSEAEEVNAKPTSWVTAAAITDSAALVCYATEEGGNVNGEEFRGVGTCNVLGLTGDNATVGVGPPKEVNGNPAEHMSLAGLADFSAVLCYSDVGAGPGHCMVLSMAPTTTTVTTTSATSTTETTVTTTETSTTSLHTTTATTASATAAAEGPVEDSGSEPSGLPGLGDWDDNGEDCGCDDDDDEIMWTACGHDGVPYPSACYADCLSPGGFWKDGECDVEDGGAYNPTFTFTFLLWALVLLL